MIELATIVDAKEILQLQKLAYQSEAKIYNDYTIPPLIQSLEEMVSDLREKIVLKLTVDGKIVGSVRGYVKNGTGNLGRLMVHPEFQRRGLGTRLIQAIEEQLGQVKRYELFTGNKSEGNIRLYKKLGYRIIRTETANDRLVMVFMEKLAG